jgi:hypothetical protein
MGARTPPNPTNTTVLQVRIVRTTLSSANIAVVGQPRSLGAEDITRELIRRKNSREDIEVARGKHFSSGSLVFRV